MRIEHLHNVPIEYEYEGHPRRYEVPELEKPEEDEVDDGVEKQVQLLTGSGSNHVYPLPAMS